MNCFDGPVVGPYTSDFPGQTVERFPHSASIDFIDTLRLTVAGTAGGTVAHPAGPGLRCHALGTDVKAKRRTGEMERVGTDAFLAAHSG